MYIQSIFKEFKISGQIDRFVLGRWLVMKDAVGVHGEYEHYFGPNLSVTATEVDGSPALSHALTYYSLVLAGGRDRALSRR